MALIALATDELAAGTTDARAGAMAHHHEADRVARRAAHERTWSGSLAAPTADSGVRAAVAFATGSLPLGSMIVGAAMGLSATVVMRSPEAAE